MEEKNVTERKAGLKEKLRKIARHISQSELIVRDKFGVAEKIRTNYNSDEFGFASGKFVFTSPKCDEIGLCVGVGRDADERDSGEELWFLVERKEGIVYWKGYRGNDFFQNGIILIP